MKICFLYGCQNKGRCLLSKGNSRPEKTLRQFLGNKSFFFFCFCSSRPELVFDKNGTRVTSDPAGDEHGVIELKVESGNYGQIVLIIENLSEETITLEDITLLWSVNFFDYSEISSIGSYVGQLHPGNFLTGSPEHLRNFHC